MPQDSARLGSWRAGSCIWSTAGDVGDSGVSVTLGPCSTTTRQIHGGNCAVPPPPSGVESHGRVASKNSMEARKLGSKSTVPGAGSVRTTW